MDARTSRRQKRISRRQEKQMAQDLGGRIQPASGALARAKGDVRVLGEVRGEAKYTSKPFYALKHLDLKKVKIQALKGGLEDPVLQVSFADRLDRFTSFAIWPMQFNDILGRVLECGVTYGKSIRLEKTRLELEFLGHNMTFISFQDSKTGEHDWYAVAPWDEYLKWRAIENA